MDSGPAPFSCAWSVPVMSVLRDAELVSCVAQSWWSTVWLGWRAARLGTELVRLLVRLGHRAGWAGAMNTELVRPEQTGAQSWLGWSAGGAAAGEGSAAGERRPRGVEWRDRRAG